MKSKSEPREGAPALLRLFYPQLYEVQFLVLSASIVTGFVITVAAYPHVISNIFIALLFPISFWGIFYILFVLALIVWIAHELWLAFQKKNLTADTLGTLYWYYIAGMFFIGAAIFFDLLRMYGLNPSAAPVPEIIAAVQQQHDKSPLLGIGLLGMLGYFLINAVRILVGRFFLNIDNVAAAMTRTWQFSMVGNTVAMICAGAIVWVGWLVTGRISLAMLIGHVVVSMLAIIVLHAVPRLRRS